MKQRYRQYEQIIRDIDIEKATDVELNALERELNGCEDITSGQYYDLTARLSQVAAAF